MAHGSNAKKSENLCGNAKGAGARPLKEFQYLVYARRRKRVERTINVLGNQRAESHRHIIRVRRATPKLPGAHIVST